MGRTCKLCGRERSHESFGGKGRRRFICRKCRKLPKTEQRRRWQSEELYGFMFQSNISKKNIERLNSLTNSELPGIAELAALILTVARIKPRKRRRVRYLAERDRALLDTLVQRGLIDEEQLFDSLPYYEYETEDEDYVEAEFHLYFSCGLEDAEDLDR